MKKIRLALLTSGGDAPGMNAAIRAIVRTGIYYEFQVLGVQRGFEGLLSGEFISLSKRAVGDIIQRGGTILHTARSEEFKTSKGQKRAVAQLKENDINMLVVIGGDGSIKGALELEKRGIKTVCIPGTIDNDVTGTDFTIGFDTAVNTIVDAVNKLRDTATSHERIFVVEVMGRSSGFLALNAGFASGAESILIPEVNFDIDLIVSRIKRGYAEGKKHHIILVAEGAATATDIATEIHNISGLETRVTVLGHIQRGGTPTALDRTLASRLGFEAVRALRNGMHGVMVGMINNEPVHTPLAEIKNSKNINRQIHTIAEDILSR